MCVRNGNHLFAGLIFGFDAAYNNFLIWQKGLKKKRRNVQENNLNQFNYCFTFLHFISSFSDSLFGQVKCNLKKKKKNYSYYFQEYLKFLRRKNKLFPCKTNWIFEWDRERKMFVQFLWRKETRYTLFWSKKGFKKNKRKKKIKKRKRGKEEKGKKEWTFLIVISAPAFNNASTHSICPLKAARCKGHQSSSFFHSFIYFKLKLKN